MSHCRRVLQMFRFHSVRGGTGKSRIFKKVHNVDLHILDQHTSPSLTKIPLT